MSVVAASTGTGNDVAAIAKDSIEGVTVDALWDDVESMLNFQRDMVHWFLDDPNKFPNGVYVVFANVYEYTDATADLLAAGESPECPECGSMTLNYSEGCKTCESCGWSEC